MQWSGFKDVLRGSIEKIWLGLAFILVAGLAYTAGLIQQGITEPAPVVIEVPGTIPRPALPERLAGSVGTETVLPHTEPSADSCAFVGSKKSNKYHAPMSRCAKQIKPENRICFTSVEAAAAKGYVAGCLQ